MYPKMEAANWLSWTVRCIPLVLWKDGRRCAAMFSLSEKSLKIVKIRIEHREHLF